jgi:purine-binding chemotaxis protein CheW
MHGKYVVFLVGNEQFGLPIESVERILPTEPVSRIPRSPKTLLGMFAFDGLTLPVIDAALRFELPAAQPHHFLVVNTDEGKYALQVEAVRSIVDFNESEYEAGQSWLTTTDSDLSHGVGRKGDELCLLLRPSAIVPTELRKRLVAA